MDSQLTQTLAPPTTKKSRLPRYRRVSDPPSMVLTPRDRKILHQVYLYRLMTREQVEKLLFPPDHNQDHLTKTSKARKRLRLLYHHGYLERIPTPIRPGLWAWRPVYRLGKKGAQIIASELGMSPVKLDYWGKGLDKDHRQANVQMLFLEHTLKINDVRIAVTLAANGNGYRVEKWLDDVQLRSQEMKDYVTVAREQGRNVRVPIIPDAYFVLNLGDRRAHFFLELDRATVTNERWRTRVLAYKAYTESGSYQKRYQTTSLRILTVTTTAQRLANLKKATERAGGSKLFWFTTLNEATPDKILLSPIWYVAQESIALPLIS